MIEKTYTNSQIESVIDEHINGRNAERNRKILKRRYIDGLTYEKIAEEFELSPRYVKTIIYRNEFRIFKHL